jgi:hypothetical protein
MSIQVKIETRIITMRFIQDVKNLCEIEKHRMNEMEENKQDFNMINEPINNVEKRKRGRPPSGLSPEELLRKDRESMARSQIKYRERNPEVFNKASKKYYAKKKEDPEWYEKYKEVCRKKTAEYYTRKKMKNLKPCVSTENV